MEAYWSGQVSLLSCLTSTLHSIESSRRSVSSKSECSIGGVVRSRMEICWFVPRVRTATPRPWTLTCSGPVHEQCGEDKPNLHSNLSQCYRKWPVLTTLGKHCLQLKTGLRQQLFQWKLRSGLHSGINISFTVQPVLQNQHLLLV
jgi:hypothetical protein